MGYLHEVRLGRDVGAKPPKKFVDVQQGANIRLKHKTGEIQIDLTDAPPYFELPNGVRYIQQDKTS